MAKRSQNGWLLLNAFFSLIQHDNYGLCINNDRDDVEENGGCVASGACPEFVDGAARLRDSGGCAVCLIGECMNPRCKRTLMCMVHTYDVQGVEGRFIKIKPSYKLACEAGLKDVDLEQVCMRTTVREETNCVVYSLCRIYFMSTEPLI